MKHFYTVSGVLNGRFFEVVKKFRTRESATDYACDIIYHNNLQVEENGWTSKHVYQEYCDSKNRLMIARV